jgi:hypothetical protein
VGCPSLSRATMWETAERFKRCDDMKNKIWVIVVVACLAAGSAAQQVSDTAFAPPIPNPMYKEARGPVVFVDEAHSNFHTADGRYLPFATLLRRDGYEVRASKTAFSKASLKDAKVLVIANAQAESNRSAFTGDEVRAVSDWVKAGGSLFLIVDHMPFPEATATRSIQACRARRCFSNSITDR